jgi:hypothetical protein
MTGMERSKTIASGLFCFATSIASLPFSASKHVLKPSEQKGGCQRFPYRSVIIHHQNGFADAWLFGVRLACHQCPISQGLKVAACIK